MRKTLTAITLTTALAIGTTATTSRTAALSDTYSLTGITADGAAYVVDTGLSYQDCRTSDRADAYSVSYCEPERLVGLDCDGFDGPIYRASESDFPPCRYITRINRSN